MADKDLKKYGMVEDSPRKQGVYQWDSSRTLPVPMPDRDFGTYDTPPKKGSYTVPKYCKGGKVIRTWSR